MGLERVDTVMCCPAGTTRSLLSPSAGLTVYLEFHEEQDPTSAKC